MKIEIPDKLYRIISEKAEKVKMPVQRFIQAAALEYGNKKEKKHV